MSRPDLNEEIPVEAVPDCFFCKKRGDLLYQEVDDCLLGVPGVWNILRCATCGLLWCHPRPAPTFIQKLYTHYQSSLQQLDTLSLQEASVRSMIKNAIFVGQYGEHLLTWWKLIAMIPMISERVELWGMGLGSAPKGRVLDIGCGRGDFLKRMRLIGWDVQGVELDEESARLLQKEGIPVTVGQIEQLDLPPGAFDAVVSSHVIEHVYDPVIFLKRCLQLVKPGGRVSVLTPNADSLVHRYFKRHWRGLEPPRHFHIFSEPTLKRCLQSAGLEVESVQSYSRMAQWIYSQSRNIELTRGASSRTAGRFPLIGNGIGGIVLGTMEFFSKHLSGRFDGEEILIVGRKSE